MIKGSHLLYTDDLKQMGKTEEEPQKQMQAVRNFSDDIHKEFGLNKCAEIASKKEKLAHAQRLILGINRNHNRLNREKQAST
jgi:hypothetical protein